MNKYSVIYFVLVLYTIAFVSCDNKLPDGMVEINGTYYNPDIIINESDSLFQLQNEKLQILKPLVSKEIEDIHFELLYLDKLDNYLTVWESYIQKFDGIKDSSSYYLENYQYVEFREMYEKYTYVDEMYFLFVLYKKEYDKLVFNYKPNNPLPSVLLNGGYFSDLILETNSFITEMNYYKQKEDDKFIQLLNKDSLEYIWGEFNQTLIELKGLRRQTDGITLEVQSLIISTDSINGVSKEWLDAILMEKVDRLRTESLDQSISMLKLESAKKRNSLSRSLIVLKAN